MYLEHDKNSKFMSAAIKQNKIVFMWINSFK